MEKLKIVNNMNNANAITHNGKFHVDEVFSTVLLMKVFDNIKVARVPDVPENMKMEDKIIYDIGKGKFDHHQSNALTREDNVKYSSFGERFFNEEDYIRLRDSYILTAEKLNLAPADMAVLHPLPRVNEITLDVDDDPRAAYFEQAQNGVYVRMALIMTLLGLKDPKTGEVAFEC